MYNVNLIIFTGSDFLNVAPYTINLWVMRYPIRFVILPLLYFLCMDAQAQASKFDSLWDELTFNIYTDTPDSVVLPFLKNHFPYLAKTPEPGGWTMYPPGPVPTPQRGMHSLVSNSLLFQEAFFTVHWIKKYKRVHCLYTNKVFLFERPPRLHLLNSRETPGLAWFSIPICPL